ncbi:MAG: LysM peptidoglycan-binding domain-containing protein [Gammaproteobacteria bacterium]|nr:LysM peptidoglycan-binding domain-containing protein [Gammaproteobacteria bacterium]MCI0590578.1 LysM peptidoglycan-binding domain-containing protein [Gammaproteobacteria bacterium]
MSNKNILALLIVLVALPAFADTPELNPAHPERYVVQKGDTLWDISGKFLVDPWLWPEIWQVNPQVVNPHLIYPGDVISLTYEEGRPILRVERGEPTAPTVTRAEVGRDVKLSPTIRSTKRAKAIPTIPLDAIQQFLSRPLVLTEDQLAALPYVVSSYEQHLIAGAGNTIYVRGLTDDGQTHYGVYRKGRALQNPGAPANEILGYEVLHVADGVLQRYGDPATLFIPRSNREILVGDRLIPIAEEGELSTVFMPHAPQTEVDGNIISVIDGVSQIGQYQVVVLNVGQSNGVDVGTVLRVYQSGQVVRDYGGKPQEDEKSDRIHFEHEPAPVDSLLSNVFNDLRDTARDFVNIGERGAVPVELPEEPAGVLMVFRTFDQISYALIMAATTPIHIYDSVRNP